MDSFIIGISDFGDKDRLSVHYRTVEYEIFT